ncbi:zonular occludens toxin domain-containing protein [Oscillatoria acuminata]|uniref:Zonular occludens toxin (Zot) n=1 Tax=Oscillatoria acuminata PCC 6304 TaxID=56110 RepID=K9TEF0_9CYAN|nr:zonular occludens toxin domain-containing protein [Oscillatoria acuminata]AFY81247.1 Zonular occludens toxin (Zot) [Oscillatoria acuminata PCC 6304]
MIIGFVGEIGSGKSLLMTATALAYAEKRKMRLVFNYPIHLDALHEYCIIKNYPYIIRLINSGNIIFTPINSPQDLEKSLSIRNAIRCYDELGVFLNSRSWRNHSISLLAAFRQSRKMGGDVYFASQTIDELDCQFSDLIQMVYYCKGKSDYDEKLRNYSLKRQKWYFFDWVTFKLWMNTPKAKLNPIKTRFAYAKASGNSGNTIAINTLFRTYDSFARLDEFELGQELPKYSKGQYFLLKDEPFDLPLVELDYDGMTLQQRKSYFSAGISNESFYPTRWYVAFGSYPVYKMNFSLFVYRLLANMLDSTKRHQWEKICTTIMELEQIWLQLPKSGRWVLKMLPFLMLWGIIL